MRTGESAERYRVFLSHASSDKPFVRKVAARLRREQISCFFDEDDLCPGEFWQVALERALAASDTCAVFIGDDAMGPYHRLEAQAALSQQVEARRGFRLIPILLPGKKRPVDRELPAFLRQLTWVEFSADPEDDELGWRRLIYGITGARPDSPDPELPSSAARILSHYADFWRTLLAGAAPALAKQRSPLAALQRRLRDLRLDRYLWPRLAWEDPEHRDERGRPRLIPIPGAEQEPVRSVLATLLGGENVVLHDDAGMGKTAFTWKLVDLLIDAHSPLPPLRGRVPLVVRLEGEWPRNPQGAPLTVAQFLSEEVARGLRHQRQPFDAESLDAAIRDALQDNLVVILVDAFDQMNEGDRQHLAELLRGTTSLAIDRDDAALCAWLITGRPYALRDFQEELGALGIRRLRLAGLDTAQQNRYFEDLADHGFFRAQRTCPLDWVCGDRAAIAAELTIPFNLREIRRLVEVDLEGQSEVRRIQSTGELHGFVTQAVLRKAINHYHKHPTIPKHVSPPHDREEQQELLLRVCGLLAFQLMLERQLQASVYNHRDDRHAVAEFLDRARRRFLANESTAVGATADDADTAERRWGWAKWMLEKIEFSHRGHIDSFNAQCRGFRDRKTMEWYAAHYLTNHATAADRSGAIPGAGSRCARDFVFDEEWLSNCWRQAIEMPLELIRDEVAVESLGLLFTRPTDDELGQTRPAEHMWRVWQRWLEPAGTLSRRLRGAEELIARFRAEFAQLCEDRDVERRACAQALRGDEDRDRPDQTWLESTKAEDAWYRRIPPVGPSAIFQGERPNAVEVSAFWLRKFVVTNAEYRLFDPHHRSGSGAAFNVFDRPVVHVDWFMASMFCRWLGDGYHLPTESQWEAACRANPPQGGHHGRETLYWFGDDELELPKHAWFGHYYDQGHTQERTYSLAESLQAGGHENSWGLIDMHGNVWEWCEDWYGEWDPSTLIDPAGPSEGLYRVLRGGSWSYAAGDCRSSARYGLKPGLRIDYLGFRVARANCGA